MNPAGPCKSFAGAVFAALTWRRILAALALGLVLSVLRDAQNSAHSPPHFALSSIVIVVLGSVFVLLAALVCDEAIQRGARDWVMCLVCLVAATVLTTFGQWYVRGWLHLYTVANQPGVPIAVQRMQMVFVACDVFVIGGFAMLAYVSRRRGQRILEGVRGAELRRVQIERQLTESRLAAARAHIDPRLLFDTLAEIRDLYSADDPGADEHMDRLIRRLQATVTGMPGLSGARSAIR